MGYQFIPGRFWSIIIAKHFNAISDCLPKVLYVFHCAFCHVLGVWGMLMIGGWKAGMAGGAGDVRCRANKLALEVPDSALKSTVT